MGLATAGIGGRDAITILLVITTIFSSTVAGVYTYNYYQFYPALQKLQLSIPALEFYPTNNSLNGWAIFSLKNPTGYTGLGLTDMQTFYDIETPFGSSIPQGLIGVQPPRETLSPGTTRTFNVSLPGSGDGPYLVTQMVRQGTPVSQFAFNFTAKVYLSSFMDTYATFIIAYTCHSPVGGGTCTEAGESLFTTGPSTTPGGGGGGL
jgi:hypothetical protein